MMDTNVKWKLFVDDLKARGVFVRWAWTASTTGDRQERHNVGQVNFIGNGFQPAVLWAVALDYNLVTLKGKRKVEQQHGFALCIDEGRTITADVDAIAGKDAPSREALAALRANDY